MEINRNKQEVKRKNLQGIESFYFFYTSLWTNEQMVVIF